MTRLNQTLTINEKRALWKGKKKKLLHIQKRFLIMFNNSNDHLSAFPTKNTPIYTVQFTQRNLCLAAGALCPPSLD